MCGIAGFQTIKKTGFDVSCVIQEMTDTMTHRGPDGMGSAILSYDGDANKGLIAFGHRRLKIIDLSENASQPMSNDSGSVFITYNGEIYNYVELKEELLQKGFSFKSASDTEVVLKAYEEWGTGCFSRFNGMWALAIFDKNRRRIILSRDRFGEKPLYYYKTKESFVFASEIKAIFKYPGVEKTPYYEKIYRYVAGSYRYVDIDETSFFENIYQVPKSSYIEIDEKLDAVEKRYWALDTNDVLENISDGEAVEAFKDILVDSVRIRLRSDVPVGCMLSGGMDSTSITSIAYKILKNPVIAFSGITGEEKGIYDESDYINSVVNETNANFHYIKPEPADIFETVDNMLYFHDEPVCTVTWYNLFLIAKKIGEEKVPVVLNGHAGDELLAGYWDHYHYNLYELEKRGDLSFNSEVRCWKENHGRNPAELESYRDYITALLNGTVTEMGRFTDYSYLLNNNAVMKYRRMISLDNPFHSLLKRRLYSELFYETVPAVLRPEDRNTMSQSIESRSPFLDYRLAGFCFSLPDRFRIRNGIGKWILREAMKGILPENVRIRKDKAGFIAPADEWFRTVNKKQIADMINSRSFEGRGIFNIKKVNEMFDEHLKGEKNHQMVLWQLICLELWFRRFFDEG